MSAVHWLLVGLGGAALRMLVALLMAATAPQQATAGTRSPRELVDLARIAHPRPTAIEIIGGLPVPVDAGVQEADREVLLARGREATFAAIHGPHPVRPLGMTKAALRSELRPEDAVPCELPVSARGRIGTLNLRTPNPLADTQFQTILFAHEGEIRELCVGMQTGGIQTAFSGVLAAVTRPLGGLDAIASDKRTKLVELVEAWYSSAEATRRACAARVLDAVRTRRCLRVDDAIAAIAAQNPATGTPSLVVIRDSAAVRTAIASFLAAEAACRSEVEALLR